MSLLCMGGEKRKRKMLWSVRQTNNQNRHHHLEQCKCDSIHVDIPRESGLARSTSLGKTFQGHRAKCNSQVLTLLKTGTLVGKHHIGGRDAITFVLFLSSLSNFSFVVLAVNFTEKWLLRMSTLKKYCWWCALFYTFA